MLEIRPRSDNLQTLDINLNNNNKILQSIDFLDITLSFYPISSSLSTDSYDVKPYEEYKKKDSRYKKYTDPTSIAAGIITALGTSSMYGSFHDLKEIVDLEQLGAMIAAGYFVQKGWKGIEEYLSKIALKSDSRIYYHPNEYSLIQGVGHRFEEMISKARFHRIGNERVFPKLLNYQENANGFILSMRFNKATLLECKKFNNIGSIYFNSLDSLTLLQNSGFQVIAECKIHEKKTEVGGIVFGTQTVLLQEFLRTQKSAKHSPTTITTAKSLGRLSYNTYKETLAAYNLIDIDF